MAKFEAHDFYCMNCGKKVFPIYRKKGHQHGRLHRKSLYCPWCKTECNAIEVRTAEDKEWFIQQFTAGALREEADASIEYLKESGVKW
jgi:hypothetical protein